MVRIQCLAVNSVLDSGTAQRICSTTDILRFVAAIAWLIMDWTDKPGQTEQCLGCDHGAVAGEAGGAVHTTRQGYVLRPRR